MTSAVYTTYFWIQDQSGNANTFTVTIAGSSANVPSFDVYYSTDLTTWNQFGNSQTGPSVTLSVNFTAGSKVYLKAVTNRWGLADSAQSLFGFTSINANKKFEVGGNIMSLIYGDQFVGKKTFPDDTILGIFNGLFVSKTNLVNAEELVLPVTHSTSTNGLSRCYRSMFDGCTGLTNGPMIDLRAKNNNDCPVALGYMFRNCTSLKTIRTCLQFTASRYDYTFSGVTSTGVLHNYSGTDFTTILPQNWTQKNIISMYLPTYDRVIDWEDGYGNTVNQVDDSNGDTIYLKNYSESEMKTPFYVHNINKQNETLTITQFEDTITNRRRVKYSYDNVTWSDLGITNYGTPLSMILHPSEKVYLKMNDYQDATHPCQNIMCRIDGVSKIGGNILSLAYGTLFTGNETATPYTINGSYWSTSFYFAGIFAESTNLIDASELILPSLSLYGNDYDSMFKNSTSLRYAPLSLPAVSAIKYPGSSLNPQSCYSEMFYGCTSLETTPVIMCNAAFMPDMCNAMFQGCTSLTKASNLYATTLTESCYGNMFRGCTSLTKAPELPATTLADGCYGNMFQGCTSLTKAPDLNATTLTTYCYSGMFIGCSNLSYIKCLATDISAEGCTSYWTNGVAANGTFVKDANTAWTIGNSGIPSGWTVQNN